MDIVMDRVDSARGQGDEFAVAMLGKLFAAAQPGAVFGTPVVSGEYTVITASEISAGGGFGSGRGTGMKPTGQVAESGTAAQGEGGGSGGGGGASARPIAAIVIGPNGVTVKPVFDITKIALTGITAWGAMLATYLRLRAKAR